MAENRVQPMIYFDKASHILSPECHPELRSQQIRESIAIDLLLRPCTLPLQA
jgi:hypothetical protein